MKNILFLLLLGAAGGCVSVHDTARDGHNPLGGGFWDSEVRKGLFHVNLRGQTRFPRSSGRYSCSE
jgi:hypothetical protein